MFMILADINGDHRIEVNEMFTFFTDIEGANVSADKLIRNMASIVVSTDE